MSSYYAHHILQKLERERERERQLGNEGGRKDGTHSQGADRLKEDETFHYFGLSFYFPKKKKKKKKKKETKKVLIQTLRPWCREIRSCSFYYYHYYYY